MKQERMAATSARLMHLGCQLNKMAFGVETNEKESCKVFIDSGTISSLSLVLGQLDLAVINYNIDSGTVILKFQHDTRNPKCHDQNDLHDLSFGQACYLIEPVLPSVLKIGHTIFHFSCMLLAISCGITTKNKENMRHLVF